MLAVWEVAVRAAAVPTYVLPAPSAIAVKLWTDSAGLAAALATTLGEAVAGFVIGNAIGFVLAVAFFYRPVLDRLVMPLIVALNSVPAVAFAPVVILWFGVGMTSKIVLVAFITGFMSYLLDPADPWPEGYRVADTWGVTGGLAMHQDAAGGPAAE